MKTKYEYLMRCFDGLSSMGICEEMNKLGQEGWKLISTPGKLNCSGLNTNLDMFVFIRKCYETNMIID